MIIRWWRRDHEVAALETRIARLLNVLDGRTAEMWEARMHAAEYQAQRDGARLQCDALRAELVLQAARVDSLTATIVELRREGFSPERTQNNEAPVDTRLDPAIMTAIRDLAGKPGSDLYFDLVRDAEALLAGKMEPEAVARALRKGATFNPLHD